MHYSSQNGHQNKLREKVKHAQQSFPKVRAPSKFGIEIEIKRLSRVYIGHARPRALACAGRARAQNLNAKSSASKVIYFPPIPSL